MRAWRSVRVRTWLLRLEALEVDLGEHVVEERHLAGSVLMERDGARRAPVVALVDRPHAPGPHDLEQPGGDQDVDVVGDGATRPLQAFGQLGHRHRPLEHEVEDGHPQPVAERLHALGRVGVDLGLELVVQRADARIRDIIRHFPNDTEISDVCPHAIGAGAS